jgi:hypothetical protein
MLDWHHACYHADMLPIFIGAYQFAWLNMSKSGHLGQSEDFASCDLD